YKRGVGVSLRVMPFGAATVTMKKGDAGCCWMLGPGDWAARLLGVSVLQHGQAWPIPQMHR
ncbi:MAG: hypothetical protein J6S30_03360, partial [Kiritimatiellae bacterium]|nr:hypothetical protein [Kiritimatiellia bacterium]